jgi:hypothetical protein
MLVPFTYYTFHISIQYQTKKDLRVEKRSIAVPTKNNPYTGNLFIVILISPYLRRRVNA